ncbi:hypothetical protein [Halocella sp. SP3-1]|uniref:hypothetical protein n=1 Tax=Halocella sp. SP3-1 TaxID=2382161 RepID=UPI000F7533A8|nr:hypothetical protein [Halocella sp. SP3-1]AZO96179.1 hypothetical protein D7D81_17145 [Halocella sp. SP3-1]
MHNNILVYCSTYKNNGKTVINLDEGIKKVEGENWQDKWEIKGTNVMSCNEDGAIVRVSLEGVNNG